MKKVLRILATMMAVMMLMLSISACDKAQEPSAGEDAKVSETTQNKEPKASDDEELVKETVEAYMDAALSYDVEEAQKYVVPGSQAQEELLDLEIDETTEIMAALGLSDEEIESTMKKITEKMSYETGDIEINGETATVKAKVTTIDEDYDPTGSIGEEELMKMMAEKMGYASDEEFMSAAENGEIAEEDMMHIMGEIFLDMVNSSLEDVKTVDNDATITLEKTDGKWLVSEKE